MTGPDGAALLERAVGYVLGCLHGVTPAALSWPTPCAGWNLRHLLTQLDDSLAALHDAADGTVDLSPAVASPDDPVDAVRCRARGLLAAWAATDPTGPVSISGSPLDAGLVASAGAIELALHGWDIAATCGAPRPIPATLAADLLPLAPFVVTDADRPTRFADPIPIPRTADPADRLIAYSGRRP